MNRYYTAAILAALLATNVEAVNIKGRVLAGGSEKQEPLVGATIIWASTIQGAITDIDGNFTIAENQTTNKLVASFVGFEPDTIEVNSNSKITFVLQPQQIEQVDVTARRAGASLSRLSALTQINITGEELCKAACCNLGESFETNASVDVNYADATTGAKTIQLLGLNGRYVQMMTENVPNLRGLASPYGLSYIPGTSMDGIQVSKGVGTVVNGYEAFTGQINVEYKKPVGTEEIAAANAFASSSGRYEANANVNIKVAPHLSTGIIAGYSTDTHTMDEDNDGFRDEPKVRQLNLLNRWNYNSGHGYTWQAVVKAINEERWGGSTHFDGTTPSADQYGVYINTDRVETWMKNGFVFDKPNTSLGVVTSYIYHNQESFFGHRQYDGTQHSYNVNAIFQTGSDMHQLHTGISSQGDFYRDRINWGTSENDEHISFDDISYGAFAQYTLNIPEHITIIAGLRADHNNHFGNFVTPRLHIRYTPWEHTVLRLAAGRGYRTAALFAENNYLMASSRTWQYDTPYMQERAWNMGANLTQYVHLWDKEMTISAEYYRTQFSDQLLADYDHSIHTMRFVGSNGASYANTVQIEAKYQPIRGLDVTAAWRWNEAMQTIDGEKRQRPLVSKYKALVTLSYATPLKKWQFDTNLQFNGSGRIPSTDGNPAEYQRPTSFNPYQMYNGQITKYFRTWSIYAGVENIGNFTQKNPIIAGDDPYGQYFDGTMIWGPLMTRKFYVGLRWSLSK